MARSAPPTVLMCRPEFFGVEYVINPWMAGHVGLARRDVAMRQWEALHATLCELAAVRVMDGEPGMPDLCFTANAGLVVEGVAAPARFRMPQRRVESPVHARWFEQLGMKLVTLPEDQSFEGEGDALVQPGGSGGTNSGGETKVWAGYGVRSSLESHRTIAELMNVQVISLRLIDQRFYHLDTCFFALPSGKIVYYPAAFDAMSLIELHRRVPTEDRYEVSEDDALHFACNALRLGDTIVTNHASPAMRDRLAAWGYDVRLCPVSEFMLAGGAVKCLTLLLEQDLGAAAAHRKPVESPIRTTRLSLSGHLLDDGLLNRVLDAIEEAGGSFHVEHLHAAERRDDPSHAVIRLTAPDGQRLQQIVTTLQPMGAHQADEPTNAVLETVTRDGVAPDAFYSTTIYPTEVHIAGRWVPVEGQRMDAMIVVRREGPDYVKAQCVLMRDLRQGDEVVCGTAGVRVHTPTPESRTSGAGGETFGFMSGAVSSERRVEQHIETLAWEMRRIKARGGKIVVVAGPVVIHTGGGPHLERLIHAGYVQALLTGNALPVHDIELNLFGTSLGVDLRHGKGVHGGHQHHLRAINRVRAAGGIQQAVEEGLITGGVMHACVVNHVPYVLAGSIRDDGPLPETLMDLYEAQRAYADAIRGADMILMLSSMLHAIGTGNMTPAGVRLVCVDISPAVVTKLADRGSIESTGIVTDVGLFLNLLAQRLGD